MEFPEKNTTFPKNFCSSNAMGGISVSPMWKEFVKVFLTYMKKFCILKVLTWTGYDYLTDLKI